MYCKRFFKSLTVTSVFVLIIFASLIPIHPIQAQNSLCDFLPFIEIDFLGFNTCTGSTAEADAAGTSIGQYIRFGVSLVFIGVAAFAIYQIIKAAIQYIRSEGDEGQVEESQKAIKSVFIGIGLLFGAILLLIVIFQFFGAIDSLTSADLPDNDFIRNLVGALQS